jgi:hypothetical protein
MQESVTMSNFHRFSPLRWRAWLWWVILLLLCIIALGGCTTTDRPYALQISSYAAETTNNAPGGASLPFAIPVDEDALAADITGSIYIPKGTPVQVIARHGEWVEIRTSAQLRGWIEQTHLAQVYPPDSPCYVLLRQTPLYETKSSEQWPDFTRVIHQIVGYTTFHCKGAPEVTVAADATRWWYVTIENQQIEVRVDATALSPVYEAAPARVALDPDLGVPYEVDIIDSIAMLPESLGPDFLMPEIILPGIDGLPAMVFIEPSDLPLLPALDDPAQPRICVDLLAGIYCPADDAVAAWIAPNAADDSAPIDGEGDVTDLILSEAELGELVTQFWHSYELENDLVEGFEIYLEPENQLFVRILLQEGVVPYAEWFLAENSMEIAATLGNPGTDLIQISSIRAGQGVLYGPALGSLSVGINEWLFAQPSMPELFAMSRIVTEQGLLRISYGPTLDNAAESISP